VLNSLALNIDQMAGDEIYLGFATYDSTGVQFYYFEKGEIKVKFSLTPLD
jgi:hypothetical protein